MKQRFIYNIIIVFVTALFAGCSQRAFNAVSYEGDDMYGTLSRSAVQQEELARAEAQRLAIERRREAWSQALGLTEGGATTSSSALPSSVVVNQLSYDTPYGRRLSAYYSDEYQLPESYYSMEYQERVLDQLENYDPALYDATIDDMGVVVIEPKYASSIYGVWGDYTSYPGFYGNYNPYWGYYSYWGYPTYTYWGWGWNRGWGSPIYDPYFAYSYGYPYWGFSWGYYYPFYPPPLYYGGYRPPHYHSAGVKSVGNAGGLRSGGGGLSRPSGTYYSTGKRQSSGATVGSSSKSSTYNRGFSTNSSTTTRTQSSTTITRPSTTTPSSSSSSTSRPTTSTPSRSTNSIGR